MFKQLRIALLLLILVLVGANGWLNEIRIHSWKRPVWLVLYPVNADGRADTQAYIDALDVAHFEDVQGFLAREGRKYGVNLDPVLEIRLAPEIDSQPPKVSDYPGMAESIIWSLSMRWWAWRNDTWEGPEPDARIFLRYFSTGGRVRLEHSLGLQKGMIGLVNGFASVDYIDTNNFVIAHELLHTFGATDKYDLKTNEPVFPDGYADPRQEPLLPQTRAEIMSGRIKVSPGWILMPPSLDQVVINDKTASEIGWNDTK